MNFAAQQIGQLATDGQAKARSAVLAAGARIGLLKRFEDDFSAFSAGMPIPVSATAKATTAGD